MSGPGPGPGLGLPEGTELRPKISQDSEIKNEAANSKGPKHSGGGERANPTGLRGINMNELLPRVFERLKQLGATVNFLQHIRAFYGPAEGRQTHTDTQRLVPSKILDSIQVEVGDSFRDH